MVIQDDTTFSLPVLTINSEQFTLWKGHMQRLERLLEPWIKQAGRDSAFVTIGKLLRVFPLNF